MQKRFTYESDTFHFDLIRDKGSRWRMMAAGDLTGSDILKGSKILKKALPLKSYLVLNVKGISVVGWQVRKQLYEMLKGLFQSGQINHLFLIYPSNLIRVLGLLARRFYPEIRHSYHDTEDSLQDAFERISGSHKLDRQLKLVQQALKSKESNSLVRFISYDKQVHSDGKSRSEAFLVHPNILLMKVRGFIDVEMVDKMLGQIEKIATDDLRCIYIGDLAEATGVSMEGRRRFDKVGKDYEKYYVRKYFLFPAVIIPLYKVYTMVNPAYGKTSTLVKSIDKTVLQLIQDVEVTDEELLQAEPGDLNRDFLTQFSKEELVDYLLAYHSENQKLALYHEGRIHEMFEVVSAITWNEDYTSKQLEVPAATDLYHSLFQSLNLLQADLETIIKELRRTNEDLEVEIAQRTREILYKESNLRSLIENYSSPIWVIDREYRLIEFNSFFEESGIISQHKKKLKRGMDMLTSFPQPVSEFWKSKYDPCFQGKSMAFIDEYKVGNNELTYEIQLFPIKSGREIIGTGVVANDITEIQDSKRLLEEHNQALQKLNLELDSFIYRSSHDMRAPVSSLMGLIGLAKEADDEQKSSYLDLMSVTVKKLDDFITEIIELTKNAKITVQSQPIDWKDLLEKLVGELAYMDPDNQTRMDYNVYQDRPFCSDEFRIKAILKNILTNSVKYRDPWKESFVSVDITVNDKNAEMEISDNGQGIKEEYLPRIFDMFFRANEKAVGSGLGLYIVKEALGRLGGKIDVDSEFGHGTTFKITLPDLTDD